MPQIQPTALRKTILLSTDMSVKLMTDAIGQILYPATMIEIVSCTFSSSRWKTHLK